LSVLLNVLGLFLNNFKAKVIKNLPSFKNLIGFHFYLAIAFFIILSTSTLK